MLAVWLETPDLREWWGDPAEQLALLREDLDQPLMDQRIGTLDGRPFAYLQSYPCGAWGAPQFAGYPDATRAVDMCIGVPDLIGRGHGAAILRLYARSLIAAGAPAVVIDPDPENLRAVAAYRRAGFCDRGIRPCEDGDPVIVMDFSAD
jgi:aminoglycoside 6'-N-acetyltransferase